MRLVDQIEQTAAGRTPGFQNLGNGYYQLQLEDAEELRAALCKTLHLDIGDGVTHDAFFQFTKIGLAHRQQVPAGFRA